MAGYGRHFSVLKFARTFSEVPAYHSFFPKISVCRNIRPYQMFEAQLAWHGIDQSLHLPRCHEDRTCVLLPKAIPLHRNGKKGPRVREQQLSNSPPPPSPSLPFRRPYLSIPLGEVRTKSLMLTSPYCCSISTIT